MDRLRSDTLAGGNERGTHMRSRWALPAAAGAALLLAALPRGVLLAHDGAAAESGELAHALTVWSFDAPGVVLTLLLAAVYTWGLRRFHSAAPTAAQPRPFRFPRWPPLAFYSGIALMILSLVSPLDTYSDDLFWVHMIQHVLIVMLIAPLLLLGAPATLALRAASPRVRRRYVIPFLQSRTLEVLLSPPIAIMIFIGAIWIWHIPALYDAAIRSEALHFLEHSTFLAGALIFWWLVIGVDAARVRPGHIARVAILIVAILQNLALALILTSLGDPAYDTYETLAALRDWGPSALTDQRIGAGVMWVPGTMMLALAVLAIVYYWAENEAFQGRRGDMLRERERGRGQPSPAGRLDRRRPPGTSQ